MKAMASRKAVIGCKVAKTTINRKAHQGTKTTSRRKGKSKHENNKRN